MHIYFFLERKKLKFIKLHEQFMQCDLLVISKISFFTPQFLYFILVNSFIFIVFYQIHVFLLLFTLNSF